MADEVSPKFIRLAKKLLPDRPIVCDIGSRDALEGISLFDQLGGTLHFFEPNPSAAEICRRNLAARMSEASNCLFNEVAVSDAVGDVKFYPVNPMVSQNKDIGFSSLLRINPDYTKRRGHVVQDELTVNATTLDEYFADKPHPDLLWVDVEGAELRIFRGAGSVLPDVSLIHVEVSFRPMQIGKPLFWEIQGYLARWGFALYGFMEVSALRGFLYRHRLLPNLPWRLNAVFYRKAKV
ncbi:MAG: FkbM family methyltransferase [Acidobacteriota bacterium]|nr:FkbM family methyltransferase [Acidobacteriota bacterium]